MLRRIFGPRRDEVTEEWRRLHNEELNDLYSSPNSVRVIKSRRMRWAGHVARMGEERGCTGSWWGNRREGDQWGDLGVDGWIILGWISWRWDVKFYSKNKFEKLVHLVGFIIRIYHGTRSSECQIQISCKCVLMPSCRILSVLKMIY